MATATAARARNAQAPLPLNGVDTPALFATVEAIRAEPDLARFRFRARNRWIAGAQSRSAFAGFHGAGAEQRRKVTFFGDADHPAVLCGGDSAPTPPEWLLHALAACLAAAIAGIAAARGIRLTKIESTVEGNVDLRGTLGLAAGARNGFQNLRIAFAIEGSATPAEIEDIVAQAKARSVVYDVLAHGVPVAVAAA